MFVKAWKALYGYPHADASEAHVKDAVALKDKALTLLRREGLAPLTGRGRAPPPAGASALLGDLVE